MFDAIWTYDTLSVTLASAALEKGSGSTNERFQSAQKLAGKT
jgi:hypothetical protein